MDSEEESEESKEKWFLKVIDELDKVILSLKDMKAMVPAFCTMVLKSWCSLTNRFVHC